MVWGCAGEKIARFFGIERKVLGVEFKAKSPIFGIGGLGEPIIGDGFPQDISGGEGIEVFVEEFCGGVGVSLVALKECYGMSDCPGCYQRNDENQGNPGCKAI